MKKKAIKGMQYLEKFMTLINISIYYCNEYFGQDIKFENQDIYKEFVVYSIKKGKYLRTLSYLSQKIINPGIDNLDELYELLKSYS